MWELVETAYSAKYDGELLASKHIALHAEAMDWLMTKTINAERSGVPSDKKKPVRRHSPESEDLVSDKQLQYIEDLGGTPDKKMSKKEASDYIEELKEG